MIDWLWFLHSKRAYTVASENIVKVQSSLMTKEGKKEEKLEKEKVFWMRHPKTGYYMPETHFDNTHVVDLENKILTNDPKP